MDNDDYQIVGPSMEDMITVDLSNVMSSTIDMNTVTIPNSFTGSSWSQDYSSYSITGSNYDTNISITSNGIDMKPDTDIKIGDRSLKDFMDKVEERLAILTPNPELEDQWNKLKALGDQYRELEKELLEKQKMWDILKKND